MDVLIFQEWAEPIAEAGPGFLPTGRYYNSPLLSQDNCAVENSIILLSDVMWLKNVEHAEVISQT